MQMFCLGIQRSLYKTPGNLKESKCVSEVLKTATGPSRYIYVCVCLYMSI